MSRKVLKILKLGDACCGCGACAAKCPKGCIQMVPDEVGFLHPEVDLEACIGCGGCDSACPVMGDSSVDPVAAVYWAKSCSRAERLASSSGGVFALLARNVLSDGGVVAGAAWESGFNAVSHVLIKDESDLEAIMRSKYVQSFVGRDVYEGVRDALRSGKRALFVGTGCQVAGMRGYLGRLAESDLFLAVDVVCHGTPSPLLWSRWVERKKRIARAPLCDVNMRNKTTGWSSYSVSYAYARAEEKSGEPASSTLEPESCVFNKDWYMRAFLANACLRPSCHSCPAKRSCGSDITLGDFWGIQSAHPEVNYEDGVSAVICNTSKGEVALEKVKSCMKLGASTFKKVLSGNPSLTRSVVPYSMRDRFMCDLVNGMSIDEMMVVYDFKPKALQRLRGKFSVAKRRILEVLGTEHG